MAVHITASALAHVPATATTRALGHFVQATHGTILANVRCAAPVVNRTLVSHSNIMANVVSFFIVHFIYLLDSPTEIHHHMDDK